jgi:uncharacterized protein (DUF427 family)
MRRIRGGKEDVMTSSPGHKRWPKHRVIEEHPHQHVEVTFAGRKIADSSAPIRVVEDDHPPRYYLPREDVDMGLLERSETTTQCPFKGTAHYYSLKIGDQRVDDAVWSYEEPFDEHRDLMGRLAFYDDKVDQLKVNVVG